MTDSSSAPIQISDRLVLRRSTRADTERLGLFYSTVFKNDDGSPEMGFIPWVRDFLGGAHPTFGEGDFTIVEDTHSGRIVSAMNLISQVWTYGGIPIPAGRPEAVATDPEYRNKGLVRTQFDVVHAWSRQRGELVQGITGIPYYYRLFGYEMCIDLDGGRIGYTGSLPSPTKEQLDRFHVRSAEERDLTFLAGLHKQACSRLLVACPRDEALWRFEIFGYSPGVGDARVVRIIESKSGEPLGYFFHAPGLRSHFLDVNIISCGGYELKAGVSYLDATPVVLDYLYSTGEKYAVEKGVKYQGVGFFFEKEHPAMQVAEKWLPQRKKPYAWYIRVPDLPAFLLKVKPVLEERLRSSCCEGYSGTLKITFYTSKLTMVFEEGKLQEVTQVPFHGEEGCQAAFPGQTFLHLLFGYRTLEEVNYILTDCWADDSIRPLLDALFPTRPSHIWPIS